MSDAELRALVRQRWGKNFAYSDATIDKVEGEKRETHGEIEREREREHSHTHSHVHTQVTKDQLLAALRALGFTEEQLMGPPPLALDQLRALLKKACRQGRGMYTGQTHARARTHTYMYTLAYTHARARTDTQTDGRTYNLSARQHRPYGTTHTHPSPSSPSLSFCVSACLS